MPPPTTLLAQKSVATYLTLAASSPVSLSGQKPRTPLIAGSVCGGVMGIAWIIGFSIYFTKRYKRKKLNRKIAAGKAAPRGSAVPEQKVIIPPDPAILLGHRLPGESAFSNGKEVAEDDGHPKLNSQLFDGKRNPKALSDKTPEIPDMDSRISDEMTISPV